VSAPGHWFEAISGLKINLGKSKMVPVGDVPNVEDMADFWDVNQPLFP
jgi:hypothetical protein